MRPEDRELALQLHEGLRSFSLHTRPLPGIQTIANREAFVEQLVESIRRIKYITVMKLQNHSALRADPSSELFDPLKAAVLFQRQGQIDEAFWLVLLSIHFGKSTRSGWRFVRDIYGCLGSGAPWSWERTSSHPDHFIQWLAEQYTVLTGDGIARHFGNHRKYETLKPSSRRSTGVVVESYVNWVHPPRTHQMLIQEAEEQVGDDPRAMFDHLYRSMDEVISFGRTAKFDYLTMIGKLGLASIEPGSTYMQGATGPVKGARLLFGGSANAALGRPILDEWLVELESELHVGIQGMQVLEDALCNWQKSPAVFRRFRG